MLRYHAMRHATGTMPERHATGTMPPVPYQVVLECHLKRVCSNGMMTYAALFSVMTYAALFSVLCEVM